MEYTTEQMTIIEQLIDTYLRQGFSEQESASAVSRILGFVPGRDWVANF